MCPHGAWKLGRRDRVRPLLLLMGWSCRLPWLRLWGGEESVHRQWTFPFCKALFSITPPRRSGWSFQMGSAYQFHSWRVFVLVCAFPSVFAIGALTTMPESPRFFLEVRRPQCPLSRGGEGC